jgi:thiol-disulfide isomerase/thioredoxin
VRAARDSSVAGLWDATVKVNGVEIPFRMAIEGDGATLRGWFFNGDEKVTSNRGHLANDALVLEFDDYATRLEATLKDGRLEGRYDRGPRGFYEFHARRFSPSPAGDTANVPSIAGLWNVQVQSSKGESAWRLIVRQSGSEVSAAILRVDGDTGTLTGTYKNGTFTLSHFSGARPSLFELTLQPDGTLSIVQKALSAPDPKQPPKPNQRPQTPVENGQMKMIAVRSDDPRAAGLPQPSDPSRFTSVKDPMEPLRFSFPDLQGQLVSNTDSRFAGKVVIVSISGSWCPNCHDEAPFLVELYRTYHARGLEIVSLTFEEPEQLANPSRVRAFIDRYQITYPVLLVGKPEEVGEKLPQAVNLSSFPTTFFIGRDGLVHGAHAGFPGKASGHFHAEAKAEITKRVEELLRERTATSQGF